MSLDDRLSFGDSTLGDLPPETPPDESGGGRPNRAFVFIAIAMAGLILIGILALVGALTFFVPRQKEQQAAAITKTIEAATLAAEAWTPTFTPSPTSQLPTWTPQAPTWTPIPSATATRVVKADGDATPTNTATPTRSAAADWGSGSAPSTTTPSAGLGGFGAGAIAVGLAGLLFAVRKLRSG